MRRKPSVNRNKFTTGDQSMNANQLERLRKDERELGHYLARLKKEGKNQLAHRIKKKHEYLSSRIEDLQEEYLSVA